MRFLCYNFKAKKIFFGYQPRIMLARLRYLSSKKISLFGSRFQIFPQQNQVLGLCTLFCSDYGILCKFFEVLCKLCSFTDAILYYVFLQNICRITYICRLISTNKTFQGKKEIQGKFFAVVQLHKAALFFQLEVSA